MSQLVFDASVADRLERLYKTRDVLRRRRLVREALAAQPGERILDVGCGPGFYVAELLEEVGAEGAVVGIDGSPHVLAVAAKRCHRYANVAFHEADASSLPVAAASFDAALSVQVLEYVRDVNAALREIHRALRPRGRLVIWDVDWSTLSWHSEAPDRMERVLASWDRHLAHPALPRTLAPQLRAAGFEDVRVEGHVFSATELDPEAYAGVVFQFIEQYEAGDVGPDELAAWAAEQRELSRRGEFFFACIQFCFTAIRGVA
jgi:arsenite methyltransferase